MLTKVNTCAVIGLDGAIVEVEVDIAAGLPTFTSVATESHAPAGRRMTGFGLLHHQRRQPESVPGTPRH